MKAKDLIKLLEQLDENANVNIKLTFDSGHGFPNYHTISVDELLDVGAGIDDHGKQQVNILLPLELDGFKIVLNED